MDKSCLQGLFSPNNLMAKTDSGNKDITERKEAEETLKEGQKKMAEMNEKLRVLGELTRHDVRNKLGAISANAYLLKKKSPDNPEEQGLAIDRFMTQQTFLALPKYMSNWALRN
jgi:light-regulated signal transduction histidine kinase (bacteriophytochrome)